MKHLMILVLFLLVAMPMRAQDIAPESTVEAGTVTILDGNGDGVDITITTPTETPVDAPTTPSNTTEILGIALVIALVIVLTIAGVFGRQIIGYLSKLVPPETAASIYESGVRFGYQMALNKAATTSTPYDDEFLLAGARGRGYTITTLEDGSYHLEPPKFTTTSTTPITSESAAASGAAAFPKS